MATIFPFIEAIGETGYIQVRSLGTRTATTKQPAVTFTVFNPDDFDCDDFDCATEIKMFVDETQTSEVTTPSGRVTQKTLIAFVGGAVVVSHLDHSVYHDEIFEVTSTPTVEYLLGSAAYKKLALTRLTN